MFHYYKIGLTVGLLVLPVLVLSINNRFDSGRKTALRFALAVVAVWVYFLASRLIVDAVDLWLAKTPEEIQSIYDGDGAKNVFALFFLAGCLGFSLHLYLGYWLVVGCGLRHVPARAARSLMPNFAFEADAVRQRVVYCRVRNQYSQNRL